MEAARSRRPGRRNLASRRPSSCASSYKVMAASEQKPLAYSLLARRALRLRRRNVARAVAPVCPALLRRPVEPRYPVGAACKTKSSNRTSQRRRLWSARQVFACIIVAGVIQTIFRHREYGASRPVIISGLGASYSAYITRRSCAERRRPSRGAVRRTSPYRRRAAVFVISIAA